MTHARRRNLTATLDNGTTTTVDTITEARRWAANFGTTASSCQIYRGLRLVGWHRRSTDGNGTRWYRASV
jgi:chloramphenicol 3-O-phosphotransferase